MIRNRKTALYQYLQVAQYSLNNRSIHQYLQVSRYSLNNRSIHQYLQVARYSLNNRSIDQYLQVARYNLNDNSVHTSFHRINMPRQVQSMSLDVRPIIWLIPHHRPQYRTEEDLPVHKSIAPEVSTRQAVLLRNIYDLIHFLH